MKKFLTKAVSAISAFSLLATASIPGFAAKITDSKDFAVQFTSDANSHTAKITVQNTSDSERSFDLFTAVYNEEDSSKLEEVSVATHKVKPGEPATFESESINAASTADIRVFAWENLKPLEYGTDFRTLSKNAYLSDLKVGEYDVNVDNENKKIYVNANGDISDAQISGVIVSENASYVISDDNKSITVTSEDGLTVNKFDIVCAKGVYIDFEDGTVGEEPAGWTIDTRENCIEAVALDPFDSANKVFMLDDDNLSAGNEGKIGARYDFTTIDAPFMVSYKIMYDRDGVYDPEGPSATGTWFHVRNSGKNIMAAGSQDIGRELRYNVQHGLNDAETGSLSIQTQIGFEHKTWHEIKMVCLSEDEAYFYADGELIFSGTPTYWLGVNRLHFFSPTNRSCKTYIDDIAVLPIRTELEKVSFTDGTSSVNGIIRDGNVYVKTDDLGKLSISTCKVSAGCTYAYENGVITVSSPEGNTVSYKVYAIEGITIDFENDTAGGAPSGWNIGGLKFKENDVEIVTESTATVETDLEDATNKVFKLVDKYLGSENNGKLSASYNFTAIKAPFSVSYKVMYERDDEYSENGASIAGTWMHVRNAGTDIVSGGSGDNGKSQYFIANCKEGPMSTTTPINLGEWHEVEMVVMSESEAFFYVDGVLVYTGTPINYLAASRLNYFSSTTRTSTVYFDDIIVRPYYLEPCKIESVSFAGAEGEVDTYIHENTVFVNAESLEGLSVSDCVVSENCTYTYENNVISVSSAEGQTVTYTVKAQQYFNDDYEGYSEGDFKDSTYYDVSLEAAKANGTVSAAIAKEGDNKILVLTDTDGDGSAGARAMVNIINMPASGASKFVVDFDVRYSYLPDDKVYSKDINDLGQLLTEVRDSSSKKLAGFKTASAYSSDSTKQTYNWQVMSGVESYSTVSTVKADKWYNIKIVYTPKADSTAATANYYVDGKLISTQNVTNDSTIGRVFLSTSTFRHAVLSYDNFKIISLD